MTTPAAVCSSNSRSLLQPPSPKMVMLLLLLSTLAGLFGAAEGQAFHLGKCPSPPVQENFDPNKVKGEPPICFAASDVNKHSTRFNLIMLL